MTRSARNDDVPATLWRGGRVYSPADPRATALLVEDGRIAWLGPDADAPPADRTVDLGGALVTPAFVDAHVHCSDTGITLLGLDLAGARSTLDCLDLVAAHAATLPPGAVVIGHGWDDSRWPERRPPTAPELDLAGGGRAVYLTQASVHAAAVSSVLLTAEAAAAPGFDPGGLLRRDAHHVVRAVAMATIGPGQRRAAQRVTLERAASLGIAAIHECGGPDIAGEDDFIGLLALAAGGGFPDVYGYWGELGGAARARELGAAGAGGDLFADGALGTRTAHLRQSYVDEPGAGHGYLTADQVRDHLVDCAAHGMQGGFHAIGDAAIETVLAGFAGAGAVIGVDRMRAARHRVEHLEILDKTLIAGLVGFGIVASVQPAFDRLWGGPAGMYAARLGAGRALAANPIASLHGVGVALAFGSDSPVTALDPWGTVRAAMTHHNPVERIGVKAAFAAHTRGGWRAVHRDDQGVLLPGAPATFAVWPAGPLDGGLPVLDGASPRCLRTVVRGGTIYEAR